MAFLELEPTAADRADVRDAAYTAKLLNQWITDREKQYTASDLLIDWETKNAAPAEPLSDEERELEIQAAILAGFG